jgi:hypothetical protein
LPLVEEHHLFTAGTHDHFHFCGSFSWISASRYKKCVAATRLLLLTQGSVQPEGPAGSLSLFMIRAIPLFLFCCNHGAAKTKADRRPAAGAVRVAIPCSQMLTALFLTAAPRKAPRASGFRRLPDGQSRTPFNTKEYRSTG